MDDKLYAHTSPDSAGECQLLVDHLNNVATRAEQFSARFGMGSWGRTLGLLHDAGKVSDAFQRRLTGDARRVDHSTAGAKLAVERYDSAGMLMAYALAGHHGGLPNGVLRTHDGTGRTPLEDRLNSAIEPYDRFYEFVDSSEVRLPDKAELGYPLIPTRMKARENDTMARCFSIYALGRMLYSSLVDADYLDTEEYMSPDTAAVRNGYDYDSIAELRVMLDEHLITLAAKSIDTPVNQARKAVLEDCRAAAGEEQGLFSLTVPTGGGKTFSSLAFALLHAENNGLDRVIVAIPFVSVVEQTAAVLKDIFGTINVLEHHSNYEFDDVDEDDEYAQRLATQNWDAPIVVTTNVQLFESLFANKPGKSRKVHNMANSVIVLDEAQTLPDNLLLPSLAMLEELTLGYGSTIVLCTATQPALDMMWPFGSKPKEIVKHDALFPEAFGARVAYEMLGTLDKDKLVEQISHHDQVLCVVGTKAGASGLYHDVVRRAEEQGTLACQECTANHGFFHLSASMTPAHRSQTLDAIRLRLKNGERCVVVSTQLVEAGVDVDFPVVYRELAGVDSLIQAAGRCNREGKSECGKVFVFEYEIEGERQKTSVWLEKMKDIARSVISENGGVLSESLVTPFFENRYQSEELDDASIFSFLSSQDIVRDGFKNIPFETVARDYRIIEDDTIPVFIPRDDDACKAMKDLLATDNQGTLAIRLQRHSVSIPIWQLKEYEKAGALEKIGPFWMLKEDRVDDFYRDDVGLVKPGEEICRPLFFWRDTERHFYERRLHGLRDTHSRKGASCLFHASRNEIGTCEL